MIEIKFETLAWPKGLNLKLLEEMKSKDNLTNFILAKLFLDRKKRRIILPSWRAFKKVLCHYLWGLVEKKEADWPEVKKYIQENFGTVYKFAVSKFQMQRLYKQREKEIKNEKVFFL